MSSIWKPTAFETVDSVELLRYCGASYPQIRHFVSIVEHDRIEQLVGPIPDFGTRDVVFSFEGLIRKTQFVRGSANCWRSYRTSWARPWTSSSPTTAKTCISCSAVRKATVETPGRSRSPRICPRTR